MNALFAPDAPAATPPCQRLNPVVLARAESFIAKHEPDAFPPVRAAAGPLHAVGEQVVVRLVGTIGTQPIWTRQGFVYRVEVENVQGFVRLLTVPAHAISATEG